MRFRRILLPLVLLALVIFLGRTAQMNRAVEGWRGGGLPSFLPTILQEERGLFPMGPDGGSIVVMAMDPTDTNILYAGTWGSGMYKSLDAGISWEMIDQGLDYFYINSLAIDPQNPAILYAGTYEHGVYKTTDGGATWAATGPGLSDRPIVYTLAVDPVTPNVVYAGTRNQQPGPPWGGGLYKSTNGGTSWVKSKLGLTEEWVYDVKIDPADHQTLYAASHSKGVFKSVDAAAYWKPVNDGITDFSTRSIVIDPENPGTVYVGTWHYGGVFKTVNGGDSWKGYTAGLYSKIYSLHMDPKNPNTLYAGTYRNGVMVSTTAGTSWHNNGLFPNMVYNVMINPHDTKIMYAGTMGNGFYKTLDRGEVWIGSNQGFRATNITGLVAQWGAPISNTLTASTSALDAIYVSIFGAGIYKTTSLGQYWTSASNGLSEAWVYSLAKSPVDPQTLYAGTDTTGFYITNDGGATWTPRSNGLPAPTITAWDGWLDPSLRSDVFDQAFFEEDPGQDGLVDASTKVVSILAIAVDQFNPNIILAGTEGSGLWRSQNGGGRWDHTNMKIQQVYTILSDPFTPSLFYAGCDMASNTLYRSQDGGLSWQLSNVGMAGLTVYALAADPVTPGMIYAGTSGGVYRSVDSAASWQPFALDWKRVTAVGVSPSDPSIIYAGTPTGLFVTHNGGASWEALTEGMLNKEITTIVLDPGNPPRLNLFGTRAGGVFGYIDAFSTTNP